MREYKKYLEMRIKKKNLKIIIKSIKYMSRCIKYIRRVRDEIYLICKTISPKSAQYKMGRREYKFIFIYFYNIEIKKNERWEEDKRSVKGGREAQVTQEEEGLTFME